MLMSGFELMNTRYCNYNINVQTIWLMNKLRGFDNRFNVVNLTLLTIHTIWGIFTEIATLF